MNALYEEGAVFAISKSKNLPLGDITQNCRDENVPCFDEWMDYVIQPPNEDRRSLFGHKIETFTRDNIEMVAVAAPRSSTFAMQGGNVYFYEVTS